MPQEPGKWHLWTQGASPAVCRGSMPKMQGKKPVRESKEKFPGREQILGSLSARRGRKFETLCRRFKLRDPEKIERLRDLLSGLVEEGLVVEMGGRYHYEAPTAEFRGTYVPVRDKCAIVRCEENPQGVDVVDAGLWNPVLVPGDAVVVRVKVDEISRAGKSGRHPYSCDVRLAAENSEPFSAILHIRRSRYWGKRVRAVPLNPYCQASYPVSGVPPSAEDGDTILVRIAARDPEKGQVKVEFVESCGAMDTVAMQEQLVKMNHGVPAEFPPLVLDQAAGLAAEPSEADMSGRRDMRDLPFVTIDGDTAKDFDDAVEVESTGEGAFLLRVAIADVSHYVRPNSPMDREAQARANSWYFPTSVEPMLPRALSNGLCSLNPGVNRLVMWAEIAFDAAGKPGRTAFGAGVIRSFGRLTYDGVRDVLLRHDGATEARFRESVREPERVLHMLGDALALYRILREARTRRGSLDFDLPETEASFDGKGHVQNLFRAERHDIHRLIEEFMIAANEAVARYLGGKGIDFPYRIHPEPDPEKLASLSGALRVTASAPLARKKHMLDLRAVIAQAKGQENEYTVTRLCVRAMAQARYSRHNVGHFGLASDAYCHFTSPIRRYADLLVHRALKYALGMDGGAFPVGERLDRVAGALNIRERQSMECEREMNRRLACLWMAQQDEDRVWNGTVSAVMSFGVFVELADVPVEGLIPLQDLGFGRSEGDWFEYDPRHQTLVGEVTHFTWQVGMRVTVRCAKVDIVALQIDFRPLRADRSSAKKEQGRSEYRFADRRKQGRKAAGAAPWEKERSDREKPRRTKKAGRRSVPKPKAKGKTGRDREQDRHPAGAPSEVEELVRALFSGGEN